MSLRKRIVGPGLAPRLRLALAVLGTAAAGCAWAASVSDSFQVGVTLLPAGGVVGPDAQAQCTRQTQVFGTRVQVSVACGAPAAESSDRFLLHVYRAGQWMGQVEATTGAGTVTSWRVLHVANRDYLELTVGW